MGHVIGCDVGTQSLKGVLLDPGGSTLAEAARSYDASYPHPGWAEQEAEAWLRALAEVIAELLDRTRVPAAEVGCIGFASQVDGVVAVGPDGRALRPAILWLDRRAEAQTAALGRQVGEAEIFDLTGLNLDSSHVAPKILWLREQEPEVYESAEALLLPGSYVVHRLTGEAVVDYSNASSTMVYDVRARDWSPRMLDITGIDRELLGRVAPAREVAGALTAAAAEEIGLAEGTKVVVGCGDEHGACLGAGLVRPRLVCDITGTAEPVAVAADAPVFDDTKLVETHAHADERLWLIENPGFVSGGSVRWFSDNIAKVSYEDMTPGAEAIPPGSEGLVFIPALSGAMTPTWNGSARGVFYGISMKHDQHHFTRALFEGCTFGFRDIIERFDALGIGGEEVRVVGGGAKSRLWLQMKADATGRVLRTLASPEATAMGAAMLAGVAEGTFDSLDDAADRVVELGEEFEPQLQHKPAYDESYGTYRTLYHALEETFWR
jgi:xylulokinase